MLSQLMYIPTVCPCESPVPQIQCIIHHVQKKGAIIFDYNSRSFWSIYTGRCIYASTVLVIVILSLRPCLSITWVLSDKTKGHTASILIPHERVITLFLYQQRLVSNVFFHLKFAFKVTHPPFEKRWLRPISAYNVSTLRASEKCYITANRKSKMKCVLPLTPPKGGSKSEFAIFVNKIQV